MNRPLYPYCEGMERKDRESFDQGRDIGKNCEKLKFFFSAPTESLERKNSLAGKNAKSPESLQESNYSLPPRSRPGGRRASA